MDVTNSEFDKLDGLTDRSRSFYSALESFSSFNFPPTLENNYQKLHKVILANPKPPVLAHLTIEGGSRRDWFKIFKESVLSNTIDGFGASYYHFTNIEFIEKEFFSLVVKELPNLQIPPWSTIGGGNTRRINYEYQALAFSLRRTMEYFAIGIGAFFKCDVTRIRKLSNAIENAEPKDLRKQVQKRLEESFLRIEDLLPPRDGKEKSVRDRLAHWNSVPAGHFNVSRGQDEYMIGLFGGGENLSSRVTLPIITLEGKDNTVFKVSKLSPVLFNQILRVETMIFNIYADLGLI